MSKWSDLKWINSELTKKWKSGRILSSLFVRDDLFPLSIPLKRPRSSDVNENFAEISKWIMDLRNNCRQVIGFGYDLQFREFVHRQSGRNSIPTHAVIPTIDDALMMLKKKRDADRFIKLAQRIQTDWPILHEWVAKHPHKILDFSEDWTSILDVLRWFSLNPDSGLYIRQLDIPGVDTKFIEQRRGILSELLEKVLPEGNIRQEARTFELRFGLRAKPVRIRWRILDKKLYINGLSDITTPVDQMAKIKFDVSRVFITENETNFLCFPDLPDSIVIFGMGYGVDTLESIDWLYSKKIYYWGDIDTHGFAILDKVRGFLPQTESILMSEDVLLETRDMWVTENEPFTGCLSRLTKTESHVFTALQNNTWGNRIRLEQERIPYSLLQKELRRYC